MVVGAKKMLTPDAVPTLFSFKKSAPTASCSSPSKRRRTAAADAHCDLGPAPVELEQPTQGKH